MKTSNKILLYVFGTLVALTIAVMIYVRFFGLREMEIVQGNGEVITDVRSMEGFDHISVREDVEVWVAPGAFKVEVHGDANLVPLIEISRDANTLHIRKKKGIRFEKGSPLRVLVQAPALTGITSLGASRIVSQDTLKGTSLNVEMTGAGNVRLLTAYQKYRLVLTGAATANLAGSGEQLDLALTGACQFKGADLACRTIRIEGTGAVSAWVHATDSLYAELTGASSIHYRGNPQTLESDLSGACTLKKID